VLYKPYRKKLAWFSNQVSIQLSQEAKILINTPGNYKHRILLILTYATGMGRNEVLNLTPC